MRYLDLKAVWIFFWQYFSILLFISLFFLPLTFGLLLFGIFFAIKTSVFIGLVTGILGLVLVLLPFFLAYFFAKLAYSNWTFQTGDNGITINKGIIWKKSVSIPYEKIQNVNIIQGIFSRMLGLSDLQVQTAGYSSSGISLSLLGFGFGGSGSLSEGVLPGLSVADARQLRDFLSQKASGNKAPQSV